MFCLIEGFKLFKAVAYQLPAMKGTLAMTKRRQNPQKPEKETKGPTVVGIGASAGGLAALKRFFQHVPADSGFAFVVVVHLSPEHKSHLTDLLQPSVRFPVQQVTQDILLEPNNVYVIPPNANLSAIDTHLRPSGLEEERRLRAPIDHFFRTLASTHDGDAIGIILTGTGSDGTLGLKEIKAKGGVIIVQDPNEAEYDGMPQSAIATGLVDRILPIAEMPEALHRYIETEPRIPLPHDTKEIEHSERVLLPKILAILRTRTGRDFSRYKSATLLRRISRRMQLNYIEDFNRYMDRLRDHPEETQALADDLLITVTSFFRDREVFEKLEKEVVPSLFEGKSSQDILRVWSVGCATGEEAYSLAMIFIEEASRREAPPQIQIFASDLHKRSLDSAREGVFTGDIANDVSPHRLKRFFHKEDSGYRIRKEVRDVVVFAPHNLLGDPPFLRINLISCRNLLIYLDRSVQGDAIDLFHYALAPDGYLLLGTSETLESSELFRIEDKKLCVFQKRNVPPPEPRLPVFHLTQMSAGGKPDSKIELHQGPIPYQALHENMLERYAPPSILIGPDDKLVHLSEHGGRYLVHPGGELTSSAARLVREELRIELQALLQQARSGNAPVDSRPVPVRFNGHPIPVVMHLRPSLEKGHEDFVLVIFSEQPDAKLGNGAAEPATKLQPGQESERVAQLETELSIARRRLQSIVEEDEASREEMRAANEEMQSSNEELRSTMEELETSKEELQSINEELQTVNQENRHKVEELSQLSSDLQNLLAATEIATLFLDRQFRIQRYTPRVAELFNVRIADRGRPISDLTHRLGYEQLRNDAEVVLSSLVPIEREIQDDSGKWYLTRILPYRTVKDRIEGVVITFIDITTQKIAESALRSSVHELFTEGAWLRTILDSLSDGIIATDPQARISYFNPVAEQWTGWSQPEAVGKPIQELYDLRAIAGGTVEQSPLQKALATAAPVGKERFLLSSRDGQTMAIENAAAPILVKGQLEGAVAIVADIRERIRQELKQTQERERLEDEVLQTTSELGQTRAELRALAGHLMTAQEQERRRLARELHDDLGQRLAMLSMRTDSALAQVHKNPEEIEKLLQAIRADLLVVNEGLREMSHKLHPSMIEQLGLVAALRSLSVSYRENGSEISCWLPDQVPDVNLDTATALYRIAQEAIRNAQQHARGTPIHITLTAQDNSLRLAVLDAGPGFDLAHARLGGGLGLLSMQERARLVHGTFLIKSHPGDGTEVLVIVPVAPSS
jgi:two-component system, chemotaxis family, CheB/CheR fusion protein